METQSKRYAMKDLGLEALVGRKVTSAAINAEKDFVVLETTTGKLYLTWTGDCCARCFLANVAGADALVDATIKSAENAEWKTLKDDEAADDVVETMGTTIKTDKGTVTFESRLEHNGYYGGEIQVSDDEPMDQYSSPRESWQNEALKPLADF